MPLAPTIFANFSNCLAMNRPNLNALSNYYSMFYATEPDDLGAAALAVPINIATVQVHVHQENDEI